MSGYKWQDIPIGRWRPTTGFWADRLTTARQVTLPHIVKKLDDEGRIRNFARASNRLPGGFEGTYRFNDSDVYKTLESIGYHLALEPDASLEAEADAIIEVISAAQDSDGYLFTSYQLNAPDERWTDMNSHEMYCGGHLMEAAVAYYQATGKPQLLEVAKRLFQHYASTFGPGKRHWVDGHEEIGLALVRMAELTGNDEFRDFVRWHLEERGRGYGQGPVWDLPEFGPRYSQDHLPVREIREAEGHSVRAMYLYSAMTDIAALDGDEDYAQAMLRVWENLVSRRMYVTGGIGAVGEYEGFGPDYFLPNTQAYCETCASIGMVLWNDRLNRLFQDSRYADLIELELYNGILAGISLGGDRFFYDNPLESDGQVHRSDWFDCSCCPTGLARFIPALGRYAYATGPGELVVNQFLGGHAVLEVDGHKVEVQQDTQYPWQGLVRLTLGLDDRAEFRLLIRNPKWARQTSIKLNGQTLPNVPVQKGYFAIDRTFVSGDTITVSWPMPVERVHMPHEVEADRGAAALKRGPVIYCVEEADNNDISSLTIEPNAQLTVEHQPEFLGGVTTISIANPSHHSIYKAVPYYAWDHRTPGRMKVFIPESQT